MVWFLLLNSGKISKIEEVLSYHTEVDAFRKMPPGAILVCPLDWSQQECNQKTNEQYSLHKLENLMFVDIWPENRFEIFDELDNIKMPEEFNAFRFGKYDRRLEINLLSTIQCGRNQCLVTMVRPLLNENIED